jgi:hypothetical protein
LSPMLFTRISIPQLRQSGGALHDAVGIDALHTYLYVKQMD